MCSPLKRCSWCRETKSRSEFSKSRTVSDGLYSYCKPCAKERGRKYRDENRESIKEQKRQYYKENREAIRERGRQYRQVNRELLNDRQRQQRRENPAIIREQKYRRNYGLSFAQYEALLELQGRICAICGGIEPSGRALSVDHNHDTGKVRGLLCGRCNMRLGVLENIDFTKKAIEYLRANMSE